MGSTLGQAVRRVAVIGGGPLGISTTKYLLAEGCFDQVDVFEQQDNVEGAWSYSSPTSHERTEAPQTNPHQPLPSPEWRVTGNGAVRPSFTTPMYNLETNLPKQIMEFSDHAFPADTQLFPSHETVSKYLHEYASEIKQHIRFATQVVDLQLQSPNTWLLTSQDLYTKARTTSTYDAVAVCSGHYTVPYIPDTPGIESWNQSYPETIMHAKFYRSSTLFEGKKVLVVGSAASGTDIANQISQVAKHPLLISQLSHSFLATPGEAKDPTRTVLPGISRFIDAKQANRAIEFSNGHIEADIDAVLYATGYLYNFPFLRNSQLDVVDDGMRIRNLYLHLFHRDCPNIAFFGMPIRIVPFPLGEVQAAVVSRVWSGRLSLPTLSKMIEWEDGVIAESGASRHFHQLDFPKDYHYQRELYDWAAQTKSGLGKLPKKWGEKEYWIRKHVPLMKRAFAEKGKSRQTITSFEQLGFDFDQWKQEEINMHSSNNSGVK